MIPIILVIKAKGNIIDKARRMFELFICGEDGISSEVKSFWKLSANSAEETFSESSSKDYDIDMI